MSVVPLNTNRVPLHPNADKTIKTVQDFRPICKILGYIL
jgi:hypothetical protein